MELEATAKPARQEIAARTGAGFAAGVNSIAPMRRLLKPMQFILLLVFIIPLSLTFFYLKSLAVPLYTSEIRFFVGGASDGGGSAGLARMVPGGGGGQSLLDGFAVRDYLASYTALERLDKEIGFLKRMQADRKDPLFTYHPEGSAEERLAFYRSMVQSRFSLTEGIVSVVVYAYTPKDALEITNAIGKLAEAFSNEMNEKVVKGSIEFALLEVTRAQESLTDSRLALDRWRRENADLDPEANAKMIGELIASLEQKFIEARSALVEMDVSAERSPQRNALATKLAVIKEQIEIERRRLTASDQDRSVVNKLLEYQRLKLQLEFSAKGYEKALEGLQGMRVAAGLRHKYVLTIVSPTLAQEASYPRVWRTMGLALAVLMLFYFLLSLIFSIIRDSHRD